MALRVATISDSNGKVNGRRNVTIFIPLATINSATVMEVMGIGGDCTFKGLVRLLAPSGGQVRSSYPIFSHYNNYICERVSCGARYRVGRGGICRGVGQVNNVSVPTRTVVPTSAHCECHGGTRCPMDSGGGIKFCTMRSREVVRGSGYLLRPRSFHTVYGGFAR